MIKARAGLLMALGALIASCGDGGADLPDPQVSEAGEAQALSDARAMLDEREPGKEPGEER